MLVNLVSLFGVYVNARMDVLIPWKRRRACGSISRAEGVCVCGANLRRHHEPLCSCVLSPLSRERWCLRWCVTSILLWCGRVAIKGDIQYVGLLFMVLLGSRINLASTSISSQFWLGWHTLSALLIIECQMVLGVWLRSFTTENMWPLTSSSNSQYRPSKKVRKLCLLNSDVGVVLFNGT